MVAFVLPRSFVDRAEAVERERPQLPSEGLNEDVKFRGRGEVVSRHGEGVQVGGALRQAEEEVGEVEVAGE